MKKLIRTAIALVLLKAENINSNSLIIHSDVDIKLDPQNRFLTSSNLTIDYSCIHANSWLLNANNNNDYSSIFSTNTEIISSSSSSSSLWTINFNQIPYYYHNFTASVIAALNSRPKASTDFVNGKTTAVVGRRYSFGTNIGYITIPCQLGYWPPGPVCPSAISKTISFSLQPAPEIYSGKNFICTPFF